MKKRGEKSAEHVESHLRRHTEDTETRCLFPCVLRGAKRPLCVLWPKTRERGVVGVKARGLGCLPGRLTIFEKDKKRG